MKKILSKNQKGGITAEIISTNNLSQNNLVSPTKKIKWYNNPWLVTVLGGIFIIIIGFFINKLLS